MPATEPPAIPDYALLRRIGGGSYGDVWLARSTTGAWRALKIVWRDTFEDERPFQREFEGIQHFERLSREHPSQLALFHVGRGEGYFYYVMELADDLNAERGVQSAESDPNRAAPTPHSALLTSHSYAPHTLRADLGQGRLPAARVLELAIALTEALGHLHTNGLVHRDVKPSNIIFVGGKPKLADIGLVTDTGDTRSIVGTEGYLAPEGPGTPQADLFALGKVLYEAATGLDRRQLPQLPPDLGAWPDAKLVFELNEIILKACATDPRQRYATAEAMRDDLALLQRGQSVKRRRAMHRRWVACKKIGLVAVGLAVSLFVLHRFRDPDLHSANSEVNQLVEQGNLCVLSPMPERLALARDYFNRAIRLDPKFAPAYVGLFRVRLYEKGRGFDDTYADAESNVRAAAMKLMEIAPALAEAQSASSFIKFLDGHLREALAEAQKATQMRSGSREGRELVHFMYGWYLMNAGEPKAALREYALAEVAVPFDPRVQLQLGHPYFVQRQFKEALAHYQKSLDLEPRTFNGYHCKGKVYEQMGEFPKAIDEFEQGDLIVGRTQAITKVFYDDLRQAFQQGGPEGYWRKRLEKASGDSPQDPHYIATLLAQLGKTVEAYEWLEKAYAQGELEGFWSDVCWDRDDERFKAMAKKVGMRP